ncbi:helix-turn-helix domain-containing protein [Undibacterium sp. Jales W-56]|uniref:helix-turn-helix domain-containing protein n=1 Tax=Undibacterium sp. Jales W-56 TaxID=2897325 RepID=UPI0021CE3FC2|nr:helix-turn-helix domain-containing protein [Undibacterium sp. Jales W-56]MCU6434070.1 helix-turn-helix domain-containing protein [Undibacterium sp. Jales W-56]
MSETNLKNSPQTSMWPASTRWTEHVLMYVVRDTRGCGLSETERMNRFPATPFCCISWMLEGEVHLLQQGEQVRDQRLPRIALVGCQSHYGNSINIGDRHSFMAVFFSDAFHRLFEVDLSLLQDRFVDACDYLNAAGRDLLQAVAAASDHTQRRVLIEEFVAAHAHRLESNPWLKLRRLGSNLSLRVTSILLGVGARQAQRRVRRETGLPLLGLSKLWRAKRSHHKLKETLDQGKPLNWAEHASAQGYADQSHMVRDCKEITGRSPQQILNDIQKNENDWMYRL